jgi:spermidine synthase
VLADKLLVTLGLKPVILFQTSSPYSSNIKVTQVGKTRRLIVGGLAQSVLGPAKEIKVWQAMIPTRPIRSALILGLGGGTLARLILEKYPKARIVGYEIDEEVLKIAHEFFGLDSRVDIRLEDGRRALKEPGRFDLIVVDLYLGQTLPSFASSKVFLQGIKKKLTPKGQAIFNHIPMFEGKENLTQFEKNLKEIFSEVRSNKVLSNKIYFAKN